MTNDDLLFRHRLQLFARAAEVGVSRACRELGYHRSWYYCWKPVVERQGLAMVGRLIRMNGIHGVSVGIFASTRPPRLPVGFLWPESARLL